MAWIVWLVIAILLAIIEIATINLVCIWFVGSAIIALFVSFATDLVIVQVAVFIIAGLILMLLTRPILVKKLGGRRERTNLDRVVGMRGVVTERIEPLNVGEVKVDGKHWSAVSDEIIDVDAVVMINAIDGVKLNVSKIMDDR